MEASKSFLILLLSFAFISGCRQASPIPEPPTLRLVLSKISCLDPARANDVPSLQPIGLIYEGLLQYSYLKRPYEVEPALAQALPKVSADGLTYTFTLRSGVYFHDDPCFPGGRGRELTAADFVYAIKRVADTKNASGGYWAFREKIVGLDEFRAASQSKDPTDYDQPVAGLVAVDRYTLRITLKQPYPQLLWVLAMPYSYAVPREAVAFYGDDFANHPVGTGPYILRSWRPNYCLAFTRNPRWQAPASSLTTPPVERIFFYFINDPTTRWLAFLQGQIQVFPEVDRDNWDVVFDENLELQPWLKERGVHLASIVGLCTYYLGFNMADPVVGTNKALRQALSYAFDSAKWVSFYRGKVMRAHGPLPPDVAGYAEGAIPYSFDLAKAKDLLAVAGYPGGKDPKTGRRLELTLELGGTGNDARESTELFTEFMDRLGIVVVPSYNNLPTLIRKLEGRQAQMFRLSWYADYPDAQNFLQLFYSPNASPGPNRANYQNPEFDALYEQVLTMGDSPARTELYRRLVAMVIEDAPWLFMHYLVNHVLYHDDLKNYQPHDFPYGMERYYGLGRGG